MVLRRCIILSPSLCLSDSTKHPYAFTTRLNFELLSQVTFNNVGNISSSIWKRIKALLASFSTVSLSFSQAWKKLVSLAVIFSIVTQCSSKVEANQNTAFDKRMVSRQKHKRANPFMGTRAFNAQNIKAIEHSRFCQEVFKCDWVIVKLNIVQYEQECK